MGSLSTDGIEAAIGMLPSGELNIVDDKKKKNGKNEKKDENRYKNIPKYWA